MTTLLFVHELDEICNIDVSRYLTKERRVIIFPDAVPMLNDPDDFQESLTKIFDRLYRDKYTLKLAFDMSIMNRGIGYVTVGFFSISF